MGFLIFLVFAFVIMWLLVVMPQRRRQAQQKSLVASLEPGVEVLTAGGLYGDVTEVGEDEVALEIAPGVEVRVAMRAIATIIPPDAYEEDDETGVEEEADEEAAALMPAADSADGTAEVRRPSTDADRR